MAHCTLTRWIKEMRDTETDSNTVIRDRETGHTIARMGDGDTVAVRDYDNARLIATAPELLEALQAIVARIEGNYDRSALSRRGHLAVHQLDDIYRWAQQAITKAETGRD